MFVERVTRDACKPWFLERHYAQRMPAMSHAYGLSRDGNSTHGVIAFGRPAMRTVRVGLAGEQYERDVWELTRLVLTDNRPNEASAFIARAVRMLRHDLDVEGFICLSFADPQFGHHGGIYQAASFKYHGMTAKRWHWQFVAGPHKGKHCATVVAMDGLRGTQNRRQALKEKYGDDVQWVRRPRKHRYVRVVGSSRYRRKVNIAYEEQPYPKGT